MTETNQPAKASMGCGFAILVVFMFVILYLINQSVRDAIEEDNKKWRNEGRGPGFSSYGSQPNRSNR